jgi:hypothetical protein
MNEATPVAAGPVLDEQVWQAWLRKNRDQEELYFAKRLRVAMFVGPVLLAAILFWLFKR